jgi:hypothetical protein
MHGREPRPVAALIGLTSSSSQQSTAAPNVSHWASPASSQGERFLVWPRQEGSGEADVDVPCVPVPAVLFPPLARPIHRPLVLSRATVIFASLFARIASIDRVICTPGPTFGAIRAPFFMRPQSERARPGPEGLCPRAMVVPDDCGVREGMDLSKHQL